jgi:hypothetical protein
MTPTLRDDVQLTRQQIQSLSSADRLAAFFDTLRYPDDARLAMTAEALQLNAALTNATRRVGRLTSVAGGALQVFLWCVGWCRPVQPGAQAGQWVRGDGQQGQCDLYARDEGKKYREGDA